MAENIFIESLPLKNGLIDYKKVNELALKALARIDLRLDPKKKNGNSFISAAKNRVNCKSTMVWGKNTHS